MMKATGGKGGEDFTPASKGVHNAVLAELIDLGEQEYLGKTRHKGQFIFQVEELDDNGRRKEVSVYFANTLGSVEWPSALRKILEEWFDMEITEEQEENGIDLEALVGRGVKITVKHGKSKSTGRVFAQIVAYEKVPKKEWLKVSDDYVPRAERNKKDDDDDDEKPRSKQKSSKPSKRTAQSSKKSKPATRQPGDDEEEENEEDEELDDDDIPFG